jgi:hypothetical protein
LRREPDRSAAFGWGFEGLEIEGAIERGLVRAFLVGRVFEEEDDADGLELLEGFGVQRDELFKLDVLDAERVDEIGENALGGRVLMWGKGM